MQLDVEDVMKLSRKDLSKVVRQMGDAAHKRIARLREAGVNSPALRSFNRDVVQSTVVDGKRITTVGSKGEISVKSLSVNQLRAEWKRAYKFLSSKTSTVGGAKRYIKETAERLGVSNLEGQPFEAFSREYWSMYDRLMENKSFEALAQQAGTNETQQHLSNMMTSGDYNNVDVLRDLLIPKLEQEIENKAAVEAQLLQPPPDAAYEWKKI